MTVNPVYVYQFTIPSDAIDENGHVNNVRYVQWMQDVATRHYESLGGIPIAMSVGGTWVVRSHHIDYLRPAFAGEEIEARTWIVDVHRVRSLRRYEFVRKSDGQVLVKGATDWVFVDAKTGRPMALPPEIGQLFPLQPDEK